MEFSEACCEIYYILEHLYPEDKEKIPSTILTFFKENKSMFYNVDLNPNKPLVEQDLKDETKAFLQILSYKYFYNENQKKEFKEILNEDEKIKELILENDDINETEINSTTNKLTIYKENKISNLFRRILRFFRRL